MKKPSLISRLVRPSIAALKPYSSARDEFQGAPSSKVFLDANENPFETDVNRYPDPQQRDLKEAIAAQKGMPIHQIMLGNGSDEVLDLLFRAFCEPNQDNVITLPPTYGMYGVLANINAVENREVLLTSEFQPNVSGIKKAMDSNSKILFLCSPNNPTGTLFSEKLIEELLETFHGLVVIDEAYIDFSEETSWVERLNDFENLVVTQTLSKAYGMAGIRLGICYASEAVIATLNKIKPPYNINVLTQQYALRHFSNTENTEKYKKQVIKQKELLSKALLEVSFVVEIIPSSANFLLVRVDDADTRYHQLVEQGIVVRNRSSQALCENTLRITIGTPEENIELLNALKAIDK
jgi:histidinol-phosphate aminotransferase